MALVKCKECGKEMSDAAAACPNCGAKPPKKTSLLTWILGGIVLVGVYQCTTNAGFGQRGDESTKAASRANSSAPAPTNSASTAVTSAPARAAPQQDIGELAWDYSSDTDPMTSQTRAFAIVRSTNSLSLDFPYRGRNYARFTIRAKGKGTPDVIFTIDKGQLLCRSWEYSCTINVRFDDRPAIKFSGIGPSDHSSDTAFLNNPQRFISEARKAKTIRVSVDVYQAGTQVLEFSPPKPLEWPKAN